MYTEEGKWTRKFLLLPKKINGKWHLLTTVGYKYTYATSGTSYIHIKKYCTKKELLVKKLQGE